MSEPNDKQEIDEGGGAFPAMLPGGNYCTAGMSLRDYLAGQALAGMMSIADVHGRCRDEQTADICYKQADAMIVRRNL